MKVRVTPEFSTREKRNIKISWVVKNIDTTAPQQ
jgi:hypothetical protein